MRRPAGVVLAVMAAAMVAGALEAQQPSRRAERAYRPGTDRSAAAHRGFRDHRRYAPGRSHRRFGEHRRRHHRRYRDHHRRYRDHERRRRGHHRGGLLDGLLGHLGHELGRDLRHHRYRKHRRGGLRHHGRRHRGHRRVYRPGRPYLGGGAYRHLPHRSRRHGHRAAPRHFRFHLPHRHDHLHGHSVYGASLGALLGHAALEYLVHDILGLHPYDLSLLEGRWYDARYLGHRPYSTAYWASGYRGRGYEDGLALQLFREGSRVAELTDFDRDGTVDLLLTR